MFEGGREWSTGLLKGSKRTNDRKTERYPVGLVVWRLLATLVRALLVMSWGQQPDWSGLKHDWKVRKW